VLDAWRAGLAAVDPESAVRSHLEADWSLLDELDRTLVVATGKAAASMVRGVGPGARGFCLIPDGIDAAGLPAAVEVLVGGHPVPTREGIDASRRILARVADLGDGERLLYLVSGGSSALFEVPIEGVDIGALIDLYASLLDCGAPIAEVNVVRRTFSVVKGGGLARVAAPARVSTLAVSDVAGDVPEVIGSGPTVTVPPDPAGAKRILARYGLGSELDASLAHALDRQRAATDTPAGARASACTDGFALLCTLRDAVAAAGARLSAIGYEVIDAPGAERALTGDAAAAAMRLAARARSLAAAGAGEAVVLGGETTVVLPASPGRGGRNQHLAAVLALETAGVDGFACVCAGSDGRDGASEAAGAIVDGTTAARAEASGHALPVAIERFDSGHALEAAGDALFTGPTGTNVGDLLVLAAAKTTG
jgi:glycerate-2-kinase